MYKNWKIGRVLTKTFSAYKYSEKIVKADPEL